MEGDTARSRRGRRERNGRRCSPVFAEPSCTRSRLWKSPVRSGLGQGCIRHVVLLFYDFEVGRAAITQDVPVFIRPVPFLLRNLLNLIVAYCTLPCSLFRRFD